MKKTGIIILAAGGSVRLGQPKQLLAFNNKSLVQHIVDCVLTIGNTKAYIVIGAAEQELMKELAGRKIEIILNKDWQQGIAGSVKSGLQKLIASAPDIDACIFTVCDQPFISAEVFERIIKQYKESGKGIVAASYEKTRGTPVLFNKKYFPQLMQLQNDEGAKKIISTHANDLAVVSFLNGSIDIDTQEDFEKLKRIER